MALSASVQQILRNTFSCTIAWQHWALEKRILTQWWKEVKLDYPWDLKTRIWEFQWRLKYKEAVRRRILWRIDWEQDSERNTLTRGTCGHKNEFKTETSVSRRCLQRRSAQMLERSQSLLQYYNNTTSLQDWYSTDHGSHTPLQDDGDETMVDLVTGLQTGRHEDRNRQFSAAILNIETDVQAEWNQWTVDKFEHFSRWTDHDSTGKKQSNGIKQREILWTPIDAELGENF